MSHDTYYLVSGEELIALQVSIAVAVDALNEVLATGPAQDVEVSARRARDGAARHLAVLADILAGVTPGNGRPAYRCTACGIVGVDAARWPAGRWRGGQAMSARVTIAGVVLQDVCDECGGAGWLSNPDWQRWFEAGRALLESVRRWQGGR